MAYRRDYNNPQGDEFLEKQSKINAAGLINSTLERLWSECYNAMSQGNMVAWDRKLDAIWNILGGDVKEGGEEDSDMNKINLKLYQTGSLNHKKKGFEKPKDGENEVMALQYLLLNKKSLFLRRLQNKQGKGSAYISDDEDDFD